MNQYFPEENVGKVLQEAGTMWTRKCTNIRYSWEVLRWVDATGQIGWRKAGPNVMLKKIVLHSEDVVMERMERHVGMCASRSPHCPLVKGAFEE